MHSISTKEENFPCVSSIPFYVFVFVLIRSRFTLFQALLQILTLYYFFLYFIILRDNNPYYFMWSLKNSIKSHPTSS